jgi:hypothetical protein
MPSPQPTVTWFTFLDSHGDVRIGCTYDIPPAYHYAVFYVDGRWDDGYGGEIRVNGYSQYPGVGGRNFLNTSFSPGQVVPVKVEFWHQQFVGQVAPPYVAGPEPVVTIESSVTFSAPA